MMTFEFTYTIGREVFRVELPAEHIGEALDLATEEMRRRHSGAGVALGIRRSDVTHLRRSDGREVICSIPGGRS